jgi:hypothetical protein
MKKVKVKGVGFGSSFNTYPVEFEFEVPNHFSGDEIWHKAVALLKQKTACDSVRVTKVWEEVVWVG